MNTKVVFLCFCFEDKITLQNWTCSLALSLLNKHWKKKGGGPSPSLRGCWLDWVVLTCFKSVVQSGYSQHVGWDGCILWEEPVSSYLLNIRLSYEHLHLHPWRHYSDLVEWRFGLFLGRYMNLGVNSLGPSFWQSFCTDYFRLKAMLLCNIYIQCMYRTSPIFTI